MNKSVHFLTDKDFDQYLDELTEISDQALDPTEETVTNQEVEVLATTLARLDANSSRYLYKVTVEDENTSAC